ncbi:MAG TPA: hypothetical protein ENN42_08445 [Thioalkalivibrio sp.]|nr:hypothetical protein [Thioalkalivibrio sp.]
MQTGQRIVLLGGLREPLTTALTEALATAGMQPVALTANPGEATAIRAELAALKAPPRAFINHAALVLTLPGSRSVHCTWPPAELYRAVIERMSPGGNLVHLFGDMTETVDPCALTLPLVKRLMGELSTSASERSIRMNAVSLRHVAQVGDEERARILHERIQTIVWLAGLEGEGPTGEILRGYAPGQY